MWDLELDCGIEKEEFIEKLLKLKWVCRLVKSTVPMLNLHFS